MTKRVVPAAAALAAYGSRRPRVCARAWRPSGLQSGAWATWAPQCSSGARARRRTKRQFQRVLALLHEPHHYVPCTAPPHLHVAPPHHYSTYHHAALPSPPQEPFVKLLSLFEGEAAKNNNKMIMDAVSKMPGSYSDPNPNPYPTETQTVALTLTQP